MYFSHHPMSRRSRSMVARAYCRATGSTRVSVEPGLALTFDRTTWAPIIQGLGTDVRTVAIDLPGHGETGGSPSSLWLSILSMGRCRPRALRARRLRPPGRRRPGRGMAGQRPLRPPRRTRPLRQPAPSLHQLLAHRKPSKPAPTGVETPISRLRRSPGGPWATYAAVSAALSAGTSREPGSP